MKYKVGDRVRIIKGEHWEMADELKKYRGEVVTIKEYVGHGYYIVEDKCGNGVGGYFWYGELLEGPLGSPSIHITSDGETTHAVLKEGKKIIKQSKAVCCPNDKFDIIKGAMVALSRLI